MFNLIYGILTAIVYLWAFGMWVKIRWDNTRCGCAHLNPEHDRMSTGIVVGITVIAVSYWLIAKGVYWLLIGPVLSYFGWV